MTRESLRQFLDEVILGDTGAGELLKQLAALPLDVLVFLGMNAFVAWYFETPCIVIVSIESRFFATTLRKSRTRFGVTMSSQVARPLFRSL